MYMKQSCREFCRSADARSHSLGTCSLPASPLDGFELSKRYVKKRNSVKTSNTGQSVSRRTALAGLGATGLGLAFAAATRQASAQDTATDLSTHPMVGLWLGMPTGEVVPSIFAADGSALQPGRVTMAGPDGAVQFISTGLGAWEPDSERGVHFTVVRTISDATGVFIGTSTVDGYPVANEDGQTFIDDGTRVRITIRDAAGNVTIVLGEDGTLPPVTGVRMGVGAPGFPAATPEAGTPTS
jgi:hypothetical protein